MTSASPILDLCQLDGGDAERWHFLERLRDVGFSYLVGHGISQDFIDTLFAAARRFFTLPEADKLAIEMVNSPDARRRAGERL